MKRFVFLAVCSVFLLSNQAFGSMTQICYNTTELGAGRWQYEYQVENLSLGSPIEQLTIWFDHDLGYDNIAVATADPLATDWDETVWDPQPPITNGAYDAVGLAIGIPVGESVTGFAVSFDWSGDGEPGPQSYEIINPDTFETVDLGYTFPCPEPATLLLISLGGIIVRHRAARQTHR